jgi:hypothetical protein
MANFNFIVGALLLLSSPVIAQHQMHTTPVYDNTKFEKEINLYKIPTHYQCALMTTDNEATEIHTRRLTGSVCYMPCFPVEHSVRKIPTSSMGLLWTHREAVQFRPAEFKYGIFLLHNPAQVWR